jgi:RNA polymerase sigma-70 factor (ECF subfamily)
LKEKKLEKDDDILIEEIRGGSEKSFDQLMQNHQDQVFRIANSFTKDTENAMDITQNIFLKVYQNINQFQSQSQFKTWLMRIAFNESLNWIKKNQKYHKHEDIEVAMTKKQDPISQEDEFLAQENRALLLKSLYELNTKYRLAVVLRYFENYSIKDISGILKCSEGVVKNILFRSLRKLKDNLSTIDAGEIR